VHSCYTHRSSALPGGPLGDLPFLSLTTKGSLIHLGGHQTSCQPADVSIPIWAFISCSTKWTIPKLEYINFCYYHRTAATGTATRTTNTKFTINTCMAYKYFSTTFSTFIQYTFVEKCSVLLEILHILQSGIAIKSMYDFCCLTASHI